MRVGLVRNAAAMVALVGLGLTACDDNPTEFDSDETVAITTNPSEMVLPAGATTLLSSRTENAGNAPTWEEITASVDASCGAGAVTVTEAASYEPTIQPPGQFDVTGGTTIGTTCIALSGGGQNATVEVTVVGDSMTIQNAPADGFVNLFETVDLSSTLLSRDGQAVSPFDPDADITWSTDNEAALTVDPATGVVEAVGVGSATLTATWTNAGATVTEEVSLSTNAPTLNIIDPSDPNGTPPDSLLIDTTVDLSAELVDPTDPPATFGPFNPETDVEWSTVCVDDRTEGDCDDSQGDPAQNNGIISVDPVTGEVTAVGPGAAPVNATWTASVLTDEDGEVINTPVSATTTIAVDVPAPTLATATPSSGDLGDLITLTGTGFHPEMSIIVDEEALDPLYEPTVVNSTTATFHLPFGEDGEIAVQVGAPGQLSGAVTVDRTIANATEPANDDFGTAPPVTIPLEMFGTVDGTDLDDRFSFTLAAETTLDLFMDWIGPSGDLDLLFVDSGVTAFQCGFATASADHPETGECTLPAGDYILWVNSYDGAAAIYQVDITIIP